MLLIQCKFAKTNNIWQYIFVILEIFGPDVAHLQFDRGVKMLKCYKYHLFVHGVYNWWNEHIHLLTYSFIQPATDPNEKKLISVIWYQS